MPNPIVKKRPAAGRRTRGLYRVNHSSPMYIAAKPTVARGNTQVGNSEPGPSASLLVPGGGKPLKFLTAAAWVNLKKKA